jgi:hypothetical protein
MGEFLEKAERFSDLSSVVFRFHARDADSPSVRQTFSGVVFCLHRMPVFGQQRIRKRIVDTPALDDC